MKNKKTSELQGLAAEIGKQGPFHSAEEEAVLNLVRTHSVLTSRIETIFKAHGVSGPQYNVLRILRGHGTPVSVYQIAAEMITHSPDMPRLVDRLQAAQLVSKIRCENDRRVVWVNLTKDGKALLKRLDQPLSEILQANLSHLSQEDLKTLSELLFRARQSDST